MQPGIDIVISDSVSLFFIYYFLKHRLPTSLIRRHIAAATVWSEVERKEQKGGRETIYFCFFFRLEENKYYQCLQRIFDTALRVTIKRRRMILLAIFYFSPPFLFYFSSFLAIPPPRAPSPLWEL